MFSSQVLKGSKNHRALESEEEDGLSRNFWEKHGYSLMVNLNWGNWNTKRLSDSLKVNMLVTKDSWDSTPGCVTAICSSDLCDQGNPECPTPRDGLLNIRAFQDTLFIPQLTPQSIFPFLENSIARNTYPTMITHHYLNSCKRHILPVFKYNEYCI